MSKIETDDLPEPLRSVGGSPLERRLLQAAGSELPSRELSERMARGIGIALPAVGGSAAVGAASKTAAAAKATSGGSSLVPWVSGALVAAVVASAFVAFRPGATRLTAAPAGPPGAVEPLAPPPVSELAQSAPVTTPLTQPSSAGGAGSAQVVTSAPPRARGGSSANELASQIALVDAARAALASGGAARALTSVRDYQTEYPNGTFRPEVAAIKIEALVKLGRKAEARVLAERFATNYGAGPLADRVARLVGTAQP
jgi:hypothetical protein